MGWSHVNYCDVLSAVWTLILVSPIRFRGSNDEQLIKTNFSKRRNKRLYILADLRVSTSFVNVHYLVNYSLKLHWIFALKYCMHKSSNALVVCAFWSLVFSTNQTDCSVFNLLYYLESFAAVLERKRRIQHVSRPSGHVMRSNSNLSLPVKQRLMVMYCTQTRFSC